MNECLMIQLNAFVAMTVHTSVPQHIFSIHAKLLVSSQTYKAIKSVIKNLVSTSKEQHQ